MDTATNFILGCIMAACALVVMFVLSLDPSIRQAFVHDYISWMATAAFMIVIASAIFLALLNWS
jgi:hypothetical protein